MIHWNSFKLSLAAVALVLALAGCSPSSSLPGSSGGTPIAYTAPSDQQCQALAAEIEAGVAKSDAGPLHLALDWNEIIGRALNGVELSKVQREQFAKGVKETASGAAGFETELLGSIQNGGSYKLIRIHDKDGTKRALFRLITSIGAVNYHDVVLGQKPDGTVKIVDLYVFASSEMISETLRRGAVAAAAEANKSFLERLSPEQSDFVKGMPQLIAMQNEMRNNNFQAALNIFYTLPPSLQKDKSCLMIRYTAAQRLGPDEAKKGIEDMRLHLANDPCLHFVMIDYHILQQDFAAARAEVDRLDKEVNDPYLHVLRGHLYAQEGNLTEAAKSAQLAKEAGYLE